MPANVLHAGQLTSVQQLSVIGAHTLPGTFVRHVGILGTEERLRYDQPVPVYHMAPPLEAGVMPAHVFGYIDGLPKELRSKMVVWLADYQTRMIPGCDQYTIHPPVEEVRSEVDRRLMGYKYSCAGYVLHCFQEVTNIHLLTDDYATLPAVSLDTIQQAYPGFHPWLIQRKLRHLGTEPWQIVLAGYVVHSLARPAAQMRTPHRPTPEQAYFP